MKNLALAIVGLSITSGAYAAHIDCMETVLKHGGDNRPKKTVKLSTFRSDDGNWYAYSVQNPHHGYRIELPCAPKCVDEGKGCDQGQDQGKGCDQGQDQGKGCDQGQDQGKGCDQGQDQGKGCDQGQDQGKGCDQGQDQGKCAPVEKCPAPADKCPTPDQGQDQGKGCDQGQDQGKGCDQGQDQCAPAQDQVCQEPTKCVEPAFSVFFGKIKKDSLDSKNRRLITTRKAERQLRRITTEVAGDLTHFDAFLRPEHSDINALEDFSGHHKVELSCVIKN